MIFSKNFPRRIENAATERERANQPIIRGALGPQSPDGTCARLITRRRASQRRLGMLDYVQFYLPTRWTQWRYLNGVVQACVPHFRENDGDYPLGRVEMYSKNSTERCSFNQKILSYKISGYDNVWNLLKIQSGKPS
ncbi:hypothetical protein GWI33_020808 [Rhynchophorus ferrugineus]|uniref:Uncharacterized protein n=1 Tax=Rhynchophorus ferrugineus TaxID=354439 RepID=A0A834M3S9_RHYFE|nr:hypothetical protein GWI33_020808 [Rhynchophorus ferrugineus]